MSKIKWILIFIGLIDILLIVMHFTNYFVLFLKPTGYIIPLLLNFIALTVVVFSSKIKGKWVMFVMMTIVFLPIILFHGFIVWISEEEYFQIDSPHHNQSLVIEYEHFTLGETTYTYKFYKTKYGLIGKFLEDESFELVVRDYPSGIDEEGVLGIGDEDWMGTHTVRFFTSEGIKEINLSSSKSSVETKKTEEEIEDFMVMIENKESDQSIWVRRNLLTIRHDENSNQSWIEITNVNDEGKIPRQQCSQIEKDKESGYYKLVECTHQWEYVLYPIIE